jgi:transposase
MEGTQDIIRPSGLGTRLIVLHAACVHGLLRHFDIDTNSFAISSPNVADFIPNADLVYEANKSDEDYHKSMNGELFVKWMENRLLTAFRAMFPLKKMILVMDNASYHHHRGADYVNLGTMNKEQVINFLKKYNINSITLPRKSHDGTTKEVVFPSDVWHKKGGANAPTKAELETKAEEILKSHPELTRTEIQKILHYHSYEVIYTPPYCPVVQPMELIWGKLKKYVCDKFHLKRNPEILREQILQGFYGHEDYVGITAEVCQSLISHTLNFCNQFIKVDDALDGAITDLSYYGTKLPDETNINIENDIENELVSDDEEILIAEEEKI